MKKIKFLLIAMMAIEIRNAFRIFPPLIDDEVREFVF